MVEIKNKGLKLFLQSSLNKNLSDFEDKDLESFELLSFEGNEDPENPVLDFSDLEKFPNVKRVVVSNGILTTKDIQTLKDKGIISLRFNRCAFQNDNDLTSFDGLVCLELINSYNESYDFLEKLTKLQYLAIVNPYTECPIALSALENTPNLEDVTLQRCILDDFSYLAICKKIHYLNLLGSDIPSNPVDTLNQIDALKELYISERHNLTGLKDGVVVQHNLHQMLFDTDDEKQSSGTRGAK